MNDELPDDPSLLDGELVPVTPVLPVEADELLLDELLLEAAFEVPVAETVWPTSPDRDTIVPFAGASSSVSSTACSSLFTVSLSVFTAALAEARFASLVAALCFELEPLVLVGVVASDPLWPLEVVEPDEPEDVVLVAGVVVVFVVVVVVGAVVVVGVVVVGVVVVGVVLAGVVLVDVPVSGAVVVCEAVVAAAAAATV